MTNSLGVTMHRTGEPKEGSTKHLLHDDGDDDQSL